VTLIPNNDADALNALEPPHRLECVGAQINGLKADRCDRSALGNEYQGELRGVRLAASAEQDGYQDISHSAPPLGEPNIMTHPKNRMSASTASATKNAVSK
jgi:hypothetical protein